MLQSRPVKRSHNIVLSENSLTLSVGDSLRSLDHIHSYDGYDEGLDLLRKRLSLSFEFKRWKSIVVVEVDCGSATGTD